MPTDRTLRPIYFETPELEERIDQVRKAIRSGGEILYVRGAQGIGKTRFAQSLKTRLKDRYRVILISAGSSLDVQSQLLAEFGLPEQDKDRWPEVILETMGGQRAVVLIDDADNLAPHSIANLLALHDAGIQVVFFGTGALANVQAEWGLQFVDLPSYTEQQTGEFLKLLGHNDHSVSEIFAWHQASGGIPGKLQSMAVEGKFDSRLAKPRKPTAVIYWFVATTTAVLLVLWFQSDINSFLGQAPEVEGEYTDRLKIPGQKVLQNSDHEVNKEPEWLAVVEPPASIDEPLPAEVELSVLPTFTTPVPLVSAPEQRPAPQPMQIVREKAEAVAQPTVAQVEATERIVQVETKKPPVADSDIAWLKGQNPGYFTLQLAGGADRAALKRMIAGKTSAHRFAIFSRLKDGKPWYSLVAGSFSNRQQAVAAKGTLPEGLKQYGAWPRTFSSIQSQLVE